MSQFANAQRVARSNEKKLSDYLKKANSPSDEEQSRAKELAKNMHKKHDMDGFKSMLGMIFSHKINFYNFFFRQCN